MSYVSGQAAILADLAALGEIVRSIIFDPDAGRVHVPYVGGSDSHADDLVCELAAIAPSALSAVSVQRAIGDDLQARAIVREALETLLAVRPNAFSGAGPAKALYRLVLRKTLADQESADSTASYVSIDEARRGAREIADQHGWSLFAMEAEALKLDAAIRQAAVDRERKLAEDSLRRIRIKSRGGDAAKDYHQREPRISRAPRVLTSR